MNTTANGAVAHSAAKILVVEDDPALREALIDTLQLADYNVREADSAESALELLKTQADIAMVVSDVNMGKLSGHDLLRIIKSSYAHIPVLLITAYASISESVEAMREGAVDYLVKPFEPNLLIDAVKKFVGAGCIQDDEPIVADQSSKQLLQLASRVAQAESTVLLLGESGTGKEEVARALHAESREADGPFQAVNCAGIPPDLFEAEFFGHEAGAFTGAQRARKGLFAAANDGTLLLDEIGELPMAMQAKLLRVMENGAIRPVGSNHERQVSVRVIAATHRDLESMIASGDFRDDLYYRLESLSLALPPLRRRGEDIDLLAAHFMRRCAAAQGKTIEGFSEEAVRCLHRYDWPGNIRELHNVVQRAVTFCEGDTIAYQHLPERLHAAEGGEQADQGAAELLDQLSAGPMLPTLDEMQQRYMRYVLEQAGGNKRRAAALLGIGRRTLYRWLGESDN